MAGAYTRRFAFTELDTANTWIELFRAPVGATWVIRDLLLVNPGTVAITMFAIRIVPLTKAGFVWLYYSNSFSVGTQHFELRQTLEPNESVQAFTNTVGVNIGITGYELSP